MYRIIEDSTKEIEGEIHWLLVLIVVTRTRLGWRPIGHMMHGSPEGFDDNGQCLRRERRRREERKKQRSFMGTLCMPNWHTCLRELRECQAVTVLVKITPFGLFIYSISLPYRITQEIYTLLLIISYYSGEKLCMTYSFICPTLFILSLLHTSLQGIYTVNCNLFRTTSVTTLRTLHIVNYAA